MHKKKIQEKKIYKCHTQKRKTQNYPSMIFPKMLMDCIQCPLVIRYVHAHTSWDRNTRPQLEAMEVFSLARAADFSSRREPSSSSTLLDRDFLSRQSDSLLLSAPQITLFQYTLLPISSTDLPRPFIYVANNAICEVCA